MTNEITKLIAKARKDPYTSIKGTMIKAKMDAKIMRRQMNTNDYDKVVRLLFEKLITKYPDLRLQDIEHIAVSVI